MPYSKLDPGITKSSMWDQPDHIVRVWIAFLAEKDESGFVRGTLSSMKRISNIYDDPDGKKFEEAIKCLESPDKLSRTKKYDGRRIEPIEGGWIVLNHDIYRLKDEIVREQTRERVRKFRKKYDNVTDCNVTDTLQSVSVSVSDSVSVREEGVGEETITWKNNYQTYQKEELEAYTKLISDKDWLSKQEKLKMYSGINVLKSLEKAHTYWSSEEGWRYKARKKSAKINWSSTYSNALTMRCNMVFDPNGTQNQPAKPKYCGAPPDYLKQD